MDKKCVENTGKDIPALVALGEYKEVVSNLLEPKGLNYGQLPKGLLLFHKYADTVRTAMEEHLAEGAMYAKNNAGEVNIHFTVSPEHQALFEQLVADKSGEYEEKFSVKYDVSFSIQKPSTDTVAAAMDNTPFRDKNDKLLFRPGGHGALIENLNDVDADVVFIKNIDNVVPDSFKCSTVIYKKVIAGVLVTLQEKAFRYLEQIETGKYTHRGDDSFLARRPMYQEPGYEITGRRRVNPVYQEQTASPVACMRYGEECGRAGWRSVPCGESGRYGFLAGA